MLLIGGCPKRQAPPRVVYTPAPPAAAPAKTEARDTMVIAEPAAPEEPVQGPNAGQETPSPDRGGGPARRRRPVTSEQTPADDTDQLETPEPPKDVALPALEPRESPQKEVALRTQIQALQEDVRGRLARIIEGRLSGDDRKTFDDARSFFAQSTRALEESDLQRALNLAQKASQLVTALEK